MTHIHWVPRQNKLEIPNDEEEVNTREIHKCDGKAHDPDTMVAPLTPKSTREVEVLGARRRRPLTHVVFIIHGKSISDRDEQTRSLGLFIMNQSSIIIYYESTKRNLKTIYICECRCYERLQTKTKEF
jgi:hypothetical protein